MDNTDDGVFNESFTAHSGNKFMCTMYNADGSQQADWMISPALSGEAQTISLYAKSYTSNYGFETMSIYYSTTDMDPASFIKVSTYQVPAEWTQYTADLPKSTTYFAIVCESQDAFMLFVDDVTYISGDTVEAGNPSGIYIRGDMNGWIPTDNWEFLTTTTPGVYEIGECVIDAGENFKVADVKWDSVNYGLSEFPIVFNQPVELAYNGPYISLSEKFRGSIQLTLEDLKCQLLFMFKVQMPTVKYDGRWLTIEDKDDATVYYTLDGSLPTVESAVYTAPVDANGLAMLRAIAVKEGYNDSEELVYEVPAYYNGESAIVGIPDSLSVAFGWINTEEIVNLTVRGDMGEHDWECLRNMPNLQNLDLFEVNTATSHNIQLDIQINNQSGTLLTADEQLQGVQFEFGLTVDENGTTTRVEKDAVGVIAVVSGKYHSDHGVNNLKIVVAVDGETKIRFGNCTYNGAIHYTITPMGGETIFIEPSEKNCWKNGHTSVTEYVYNGDETTLTITGSSYTPYIEIETKISTHIIPSDALAGSNITYVSMPRDVISVGEYLFEGCENLCAIKWNSEMSPLTDEAVAGIDSPNVLLYVDSENADPSSINNVIVNGRAKGITLSDGYPYSCPEPFRAEHISYTHSYTQETPIGGCSGWETLTLPFDVQRITHEGKGEVKPFHAATGEYRPFWLYEMADGTFMPTERILANRPYIVSFPNNDEYADQYIIAGNITFESFYCDVPQTEMHIAEGDGMNFVPTLKKIPQSDEVYALNIYDERMTPGSRFIYDYRTVEPFEAYLTSAHSTMRAPMLNISEMMGSATSLPTLPVADALWSVYAQRGVLYVSTSVEQTVPLYTVTGALVRLLDLKPGVNTVTGLPSGLYIIKATKITL